MNNKKYIEAEKFVEFFGDWYTEEGTETGFIGPIKDLVNQMPAADVVEVVRCKDCKHYNAGFECLIEGYGIERDKDWYCGDAERGEKE